MTTISKQSYVDSRYRHIWYYHAYTDATHNHEVPIRRDPSNTSPPTMVLVPERTSCARCSCTNRRMFRETTCNVRYKQRSFSSESATMDMCLASRSRDGPPCSWLEKLMLFTIWGWGKEPLNTLMRLPTMPLVVATILIATTTIATTVTATIKLYIFNFLSCCY